MLVEDLVDPLGLQPRHIGEGVEVVVNEERRVRPQIFFLQPRQDLGPHRPPLRKVRGVRPQPPHLLQNRLEHPRPALGRNLGDVSPLRSLHPLVPRHQFYHLLHGAPEHRLHLVLPDAKHSEQLSRACVGQHAWLVRQPGELGEGESSEAAPQRRRPRLSEEHGEHRLKRGARLLPQSQRNDQLQEYVVHLVKLLACHGVLRPNPAQLPHAPLVVIRP
mmetsp:Transcript_57710/g.136130  ORF Transcript_57710/g.136130 Transcript_57710/m.136130 type:complete len:218 (+) Transcript_57710:853-1506(+)